MTNEHPAVICMAKALIRHRLKKIKRAKMLPKEFEALVEFTLEQDYEKWIQYAKETIVHNGGRL